MAPPITEAALAAMVMAWGPDDPSNPIARVTLGLPEYTIEVLVDQLPVGIERKAAREELMTRIENLFRRVHTAFLGLQFKVVVRQHPATGAEPSETTIHYHYGPGEEMGRVIWQRPNEEPKAEVTRL